MKTLLRAASLIGAMLIGVMTVDAQTVRYLQLPPTGNATLPQTFNLPCYGNVEVTLVSPTPATFWHQAPPVENGSSPPFSWGNDTNRFNVLAPGNINYTVRFNFMNGPPVASRLFIVVAGLANGSIARISTVPPSAPGTIREVSAGNTSTTTLSGSQLSWGGGPDPSNTGWAMYQTPPNASFTTVLVDLAPQIAGDGVGWTLGYVCEPGGLTVQKTVTGAPLGFQGNFTFRVECMTQQGLTQQNVSIAWPSTSVSVPGIPAGTTCKVIEDPNLPTLPSGFLWSGTSYSPASGTITTTASGGTVTVANTVRPCRDTCEVRIVKNVVGAPSGFAGTFGGVLSCWISGNLTTFPVTIDFPTTSTATVTNVPLGASCTFQETTRPTLPAPFQWLPPAYSTPFGAIAVVNCTQTITVTNRTTVCCDTPGNP